MIMIKQRVLLSISGGRSSALMAYLFWKRFSHKYDFLFVFANTSREKEETLRFVHELTFVWGMPIIWVEAVVHHGQRKASTHRQTNYYDAKRNGEVFEDVIKKYGIPNSKFKHCTRELKTKPIRDFAKSQGWGYYKSYLTAIGFRSDEPKRVNLIKAEKEHQIYLLWNLGIKKQDVAVFWGNQLFDLLLEDWEGNCKLCHKKSYRKLLTQIKRDPGTTEFIKDMEVNYEQVKPVKMKHDKTPVRFFRRGESIDELVLMSKDSFTESIDQSTKTDGAEYDFDLDEQEECAESCEPF